MIGTKGLSRWLNLLLFQIGIPNGTRGPLFRVAASRARLMELLTCAGGESEDPEVKDRGDAAFLTGTLSLVHVLLGVERSVAGRGLVMPDEMRAALTSHEGPMGRFLRLSECLDNAEFAEFAEFAEVVEICAELSISARDLWGYQRAAFDWVTQMA